jgi:hypothetical protein
LATRDPGFELSYSLPLNSSLAFTFNAGHNARIQDREYITPTWGRVRMVQTAGTLNSVLNIFTKDIAAAGADYKIGKSVFRTRVDFTRQDSIPRQNVFNYTLGAGATGGEDFSEGAATGVGSVGQTVGQSINQYRRLLNARVGQTYTGDVWKFDWSLSYSSGWRIGLRSAHQLEETQSPGRRRPVNCMIAWRRASLPAGRA